MSGKCGMKHFGESIIKEVPQDERKWSDQS